MSVYEKLRTATFADRVATHEQLAAQHAEHIEARRALARTYLDAHPPTIEIAQDRAVAVAPLVEESRAAREEAIALAQGRKATVDNVALEFPVLGHELAPDGPVIRFGTDPLVLAPVIEYLGMVPILFNLFVTRAHQPEIVANSAHRFHVDPEDVRSFKVFVHLTDVDEDCGPFHALPSGLTEKVLADVGYTGITFLDDERVAELVGWDSVVRSLGPAGTVAFADTTRCLHFGGRPRKEGKPVRDMIVYQYLLPTSILFTGEKAHGPRDFLHQLQPTGDAMWDALIGATHA
jgi:hypothetical protein